MAIELALLYSCEPRERLGRGDEARGTERIMECLKAKGRAEGRSDDPAVEAMQQLLQYILRVLDAQHAALCVRVMMRLTRKNA